MPAERARRGIFGGLFAPNLPVLRTGTLQMVQTGPKVSGATRRGSTRFLHTYSIRLNTCYESKRRAAVPRKAVMEDSDLTTRPLGLAAQGAWLLPEHRLKAELPPPYRRCSNNLWNI